MADMVRLDLGDIAATAERAARIRSTFDRSDDTSRRAADACGHDDLAHTVRRFASTWDDRRRGMSESLGVLAGVLAIDGETSEVGIVEFRHLAAAGERRGAVARLEGGRTAAGEDRPLLRVRRDIARPTSPPGERKERRVSAQRREAGVAIDDVVRRPVDHHLAREHGDIGGARTVADLRSAANDLGVAAGRTSTRRGGEIQRVIDRCRQRLGEIFGAASPQHVVFTLNGTDSLHLALNGLVRPSSHAGLAMPC